MKYFLIATALLFVACSKHEAPAVGDSLLTTPMQSDAPSRPVQQPNGLVIDSSVVQESKDAAPIKQLDPKVIVEIYDAYRPLRNEHASQPRIDSFLRAHKITATQLHAVLSEGDQLGWSAAPQK